MAAILALIAGVAEAVLAVGAIARDSKLGERTEQENASQGNRAIDQEVKRTLIACLLWM